MTKSTNKNHKRGFRLILIKIRKLIIGTTNYPSLRIVSHLLDFSLRNAYLFSHGMGFFLFEKELDKNQDYFELKINKKDLNDVLTSIMVFTSTGTITSIAYSSDIKETIKEKYLDYDNYFDYILSTMRGQDLKFTLKDQEQAVIGSLIGSESYDSSFNRKKNVVEKYFVLFDSSSNQLLQVPFTQVNNIEPVDYTVRNEILKTLEVFSAQYKEETVLKIY